MKTNKIIYTCIIIANLCYYTYWICSKYDNYNYPSLIEAFQIAQKENKDIFVVMTNGDCNVCKDYLDSINNDKNFSKKIKKHYIFVEHDVSLAGNKYLCQIMKEFSFPITYIFTPNGKLKTMSLGNNLNRTKNILDNIENNCDSSNIQNIDFNINTKEYQTTISHCLKAFLQHNNIINGSALESIDSSINSKAYFYNMYLKTKILEQINIESAIQYSKNNFSNYRFDNIDKILYKDLVDELKFISNSEVCDSINNTTLVFKNKIIDLGHIKHKEKCQFNFIAKNISNIPILINDVRISCKCMDLEWNTDPILPGKYTNIKVNFDTSKKGTFSKVLYVTTIPNDVISLIVKCHIY